MTDNKQNLENKKKLKLGNERSLHMESEIFGTLKNKYDLTLCQSRLHIASETFVGHKKIRIRFDFLRFCIRNKHFDRKGWRIRKNNNKKTHTKISDSVCKDLKTKKQILFFYGSVHNYLSWM